MKFEKVHLDYRTLINIFVIIVFTIISFQNFKVYFESQNLKKDPIKFTKVEENENKVFYLKGKAYDGLNIVSYRDNNYDYKETHLIDMNGETVHVWKTNLNYPDKGYLNKTNNHTLLKLLPNGDSLVNVYQLGFFRMDWNSNIIWNKEGRFHHDFYFDDEYIYVLMWENRYLDYNNVVVPIMDEIFVKMDYDGNILEKKSLYDILKKVTPDKSYENIISYMRDNNIFDELQQKPDNYLLKSNTPFDIYHLNSMQLIEQDNHPVFKKGQILVSPRTLNKIIVLDPKTDKIIWEYSGELIKQHNPTLLDNGNILIYDNGGAVDLNEVRINGVDYERNIDNRSNTRIIEINPVTKNIVWSYNTTNLSPVLGSAQRMPNGNTIFVDNAKVGNTWEVGVIYEITKEREIVWRYKLPYQGMTFYRTHRLLDWEEGVVERMMEAN